MNTGPHFMFYVGAYVILFIAIMLIEVITKEPPK